MKRSLLLHDKETLLKRRLIAMACHARRLVAAHVRHLLINRQCK